MTHSTNAVAEASQTELNDCAQLPLVRLQPICLSACPLVCLSAQSSSRQACCATVRVVSSMPSVFCVIAKSMYPLMIDSNFSVRANLTGRNDAGKECDRVSQVPDLANTMIFLAYCTDRYRFNYDYSAPKGTILRNKRRYTWEPPHTTTRKGGTAREHTVNPQVH